MTNQTIWLMVFNIISKILGFIREISISFAYGVSEFTDVYFLSLGIPAIFYNIIVLGLSSSYISINNTLINKEGEIEVKKYNSKIIKCSIIFGLILSILGLLFSGLISNIFSTNMKEYYSNMLVNSLRIIFLSLSTSGISAILTGYLNNNGKYNYPLIGGILSNIIIISSIFLSKKFGFIFLIFGALIGIMSQALVLLISSINNGFNINFSKLSIDKNVNDTFKMALPIFFSVAVTELNYFVDKYIASLFQTGSISLINFSTRLYLFFNSLLIVPVVTIIYPKLSKLLNKKLNSSVKKVLDNGLRLGVILIIPTMFFIIFFSEEVVNFIFNRGEFNKDNVIIVSKILSIYILSLFPVLISEILNKILYSNQNTRTSLLITMFTICINIIISYISSKMIGIVGIAIGTTISNYIGGFIYFYILIKNNKINIFSNNIIFIIKVIVCSTVSIFFAILINRYIYNIGIFFIGIIFLTIYIFLNLFFNFSEIKELTSNK